MIEKVPQLMKKVAKTVAEAKKAKTSTANQF
jgi:hypothetical protein